MNNIVEIDDDLNNEFDDYSATADDVILDEKKTGDSDFAKSEDDSEAPYGKKVQKRIDKLVYERNIERQEKEQLKSRLEALEARINKDDTEKARQNIDERLKELQRKKIEHYENGETDKAVEIDDDIIELKLQQREAKRQSQQEYQQQQQPSNAIPQAQSEWLERNEWYYNPGKAQIAQKANQTYQLLINEGFDPNDEDTYAELDKRLGKVRQSAPSPMAPDRGQAVGSGRQVKFTVDDANKLRSWGLDPNDPVVRKEYIQNRKGA